MKKICNDALSLLEKGESFVQATILASSGSTPGRTGSCMLVRSDGSIRGTVGGGAVEAGVIKSASAVMATKRARVINVVLDGSDEAAPGVICGGTATVLVDYIDAGHPGNAGFYNALHHALAEGLRSMIVIAPPAGSGDGKGTRSSIGSCIESISGDGEITSSDRNGGAPRCQCLLPSSGPPQGAEGFHPGILKALREREGSYDAFTRLDDHDVYFLRIGSDGMAYIFGAGHCGEKLAHILHTVGFGTVVIDDRSEFANAGRFPEADEIIVPEKMDAPFESIKWGGDSYVVIVTRGHAHDELVLRSALRTKAGYVGMIGSRKKRESIYKRLLADGYTQEDIDKVYSPIGVAIGAETPEEIAISIAAEMIKVRAERR